MNENYYELAKSGYEAYSKTTDNKNFRGEEMPKFDDLPEKIKDAWSNAAKIIESSSAERLKTDFAKNENEYIPVQIESDDDGHDFIIPNELAESFSAALEKASATDDYDDIDKFEKYMTGGDVNSYQVYITKNELERLTQKR